MDWLIQALMVNMGVTALASITTAILWNSTPFQHRTLGSRWRGKFTLIVVAVALVSPVLTALLSHALETVPSLSKLPGAHFAFFVFGYSVVIFTLMLGWSRKAS